jgi:hypothetical protein
MSFRILPIEIINRHLSHKNQNYSLLYRDEKWDELRETETVACGIKVNLLKTNRICFI